MMLWWVSYIGKKQHLCLLILQRLLAGKVQPCCSIHGGVSRPEWQNLRWQERKPEELSVACSLLRGDAEVQPFVVHLIYKGHCVGQHHCMSNSSHLEFCETYHFSQRCALKEQIRRLALLASVLSGRRDDKHPIRLMISSGNEDRKTLTKRLGSLKQACSIICKHCFPCRRKYEKYAARKQFLFISDRNKGLKPALKEVFPYNWGELCKSHRQTWHSRGLPGCVEGMPWLWQRHILNITTIHSQFNKGNGLF